MDILFIKKLKKFIIYKMISAYLVVFLLVFLIAYGPIIGYVIKSHYTALTLPYGIVLLLSMWNYFLVAVTPPIYRKISKELSNKINSNEIEPWIIAEIGKIDGDEILFKIELTVRKLPDSDYKKELTRLLEPIKGRGNRAVGFIYATKGYIRLNKLIEKLESQK